MDYLPKQTRVGEAGSLSLLEFAQTLPFILYPQPCCDSKKFINRVLSLLSVNEYRGVCVQAPAHGGTGAKVKD